MENHLVTFFSDGADGVKLVGVGLTDSMIDKLKRDGAALEPATRTQQGVDLVLAYAPDMPALIDKLNDLLGDKIGEVRHV